MKFFRSEEGQSLVEFAILSTVMVLLLLAPVDIYRVIYAKMTLGSAASSSLGQIEKKDIELGKGEVQQVIQQYVFDNFKGRIEAGRVNYDDIEMSGKITNEYTYRKYSSDREPENPDDREAQYGNLFIESDGSYDCVDVKVKLKYDIIPVTPYGKQWAKSQLAEREANGESVSEADKSNPKIRIVSPEYSASIYMGVDG